MANLFVIRHGETVHNRDGIIQGPRIDSELSETGQRQAAALGDAFDETPLDVVFASPLRRARDTAAALVREEPVPIQVVPELYEMDFGELCGRHVDEVRPVLEQYADDWGQGFVDRAMPGGESPLLVQHRIRAFARRILEADGDIGIVAHGRLNRVLLTALTGQPLPSMAAFPQANAAITHLRVDGGIGHVQRLNDTSHWT